MDIPTKEEFDLLIALTRPGDRDDLLEVVREDFDEQSLATFFGAVFDDREQRMRSLRISSASRWFLSQQSYVQAQKLFWSDLSRDQAAPWPHAPRQAYVEKMTSVTLERVREPTPQEVDQRQADLMSGRSWRPRRSDAQWSAWRAKQFSLPDVIDEARASLVRVVRFDFLGYQRQIAIAFNDYFWDDVERELREVGAIDKARRALSELRSVIEGQYRDAYPPEVELEKSGRARTIADDLASIEQRLMVQRLRKMPKMRRDAALAERLLLWNLRGGLRKVRKGNDRAACLTELMHLEGVRGQWDRRTVDKHLAAWKKPSAKHVRISLFPPQIDHD